MDAIEAWHALLRPDVELSPQFTPRFVGSDAGAQADVRRPRFTARSFVPFSSRDADEARMRHRGGEHRRARRARDARGARHRLPLFEQLGVTEAEARLVRLDPGYARASTASRLDAFLLPDSLHFAEYNAESPAGTGVYAAALRAVRRHCR